MPLGVQPHPCTTESIKNGRPDKSGKFKSDSKVYRKSIRSSSTQESQMDVAFQVTDTSAGSLDFPTGSAAGELHPQKPYSELLTDRCPNSAVDPKLQLMNCLRYRMRLPDSEPPMNRRRQRPVEADSMARQSAVLYDTFSWKILIQQVVWKSSGYYWSEIVQFQPFYLTSDTTCLYFHCSTKRLTRRLRFVWEKM